MPMFNFVRECFTLRDEFYLDELERALVKAEELRKQHDLTDGHAPVARFKGRGKGQGARGVKHGGGNSGGD